MLCVFVGAMILLIVSGDGAVQNSSGTTTRLYLLPWVALTAAVIAAPSLYLYSQGKFNFFNPLVFAAWSYFVPAFIVGGLILTFGLSTEQYFYAFIEDPETDLPWTFVYISLGYLGLSVGFFLPFAKSFGTWTERRLPVWDWKASNLMLPGVALLILGSLNTGLAFAAGVLGYQKAAEYGTYDGIIFLFSLFLFHGTFLLWFALFRTTKWNFNHYSIIGLLIFTTLLRAAFAGNRSSMIHTLFFVFAAYILAGREIKFKHGLIASGLMVFVLLIGTIYGSTFRDVKQTEARVSIEQYIEFIPQTVDAVTRKDLGAVLLQGVDKLAERLENVTSVAVVVSNYEKLKPYEELYGLEDNIIKDMTTFLIPRVLWKDKPVASEPRKYAELYFDYNENSFSATPMSDLLRNFGPFGVPLGMMLLGFVLRGIWATFIENQPPNAWRAAFYFMLLFTVSYEGFYGSILPYLVRVGTISIVGTLFVAVLIHLTQKNGAGYLQRS